MFFAAERCSSSNSSSGGGGGKNNLTVCTHDGILYIEGEVTK